ncbi:MAG: PQQ-dependent sugar dehydrogenase [Candidatus Acidiferrales bacterium]
MKPILRILGAALGVCTAISLFLTAMAGGQNASFHNAPATASETKNPLNGKVPSNAKRLYATACSKCHGDRGDGMGNIPSLAHGPSQSASDGELFWFITKGDVNNGMPPWSSLPEQDRWAIVSYVKSLGRPGASSAKSPAAAPAPEESSAIADASLPLPKPPFTDYRLEKPGQVRKITLADLPEPFRTPSAGNGPKVVRRPENAWPKVPAGFKVELYAQVPDEPRLIRTAPSGDFFVADSKAGLVRTYRGITVGGQAEQSEIFATGLTRPFGINFYPPGPNPQWVYVGNTGSIVRFPYQSGDLKARGPAEHIVDVPADLSHWTRDIQFTPDGKKMFVSVGSASNVDDPDTTPAEKNRADVLEFNPDGSDMRIYAYGIRNCVGMAVNPKTSELWCSVNERDALGDNLVPDYITHVQDGGFYGWPWWYMGGHQDPRHPGTHPELKDKVITPDVILNPHNASLEMAFYEGKMFPAEYRGDVFASEHGSWNRSDRVGYELIRVPLHQTGHATGEYEDFMTGFVVDSGHVWGRPVGVTVAPDGSLLVTDDGSKSIWRIVYTGKQATPGK